MTKMTETAPSQMTAFPVVLLLLFSGMSMSWSSVVETLQDDDVREKLAALLAAAVTVLYLLLLLFILLLLMSLPL